MEMCASQPTARAGIVRFSVRGRLRCGRRTNIRACEAMLEALALITRIVVDNCNDSLKWMRAKLSNARMNHSPRPPLLVVAGIMNFDVGAYRNEIDRWCPAETARRLSSPLVQPHGGTEKPRWVNRSI